MLVSIIRRLFVKAIVAFLFAVGIASYGLYAAGGDPGALMAKITKSLGQSVVHSAGGIGDDVAGALGSTVGTLTGETPAALDRRDTIYRWTDENGVTHFGNRPSDIPAGISVEATIRIHPDQNVVSGPDRLGETTRAASASGFEALGIDEHNLPGMAGALQKAGLLTTEVVE
ncbi:MAG: hypothetical protein CSB44_10135 [Gammaproteobacteria bacterium]|nr:MAG: hypothetical protein CSB44_10135 [Gammaproteobacteria bacterium]